MELKVDYDERIKIVLEKKTVKKSKTFRRKFYLALLQQREKFLCQAGGGGGQ